MCVLLYILTLTDSRDRANRLPQGSDARLTRQSLTAWLRRVNHRSRNHRLPLGPEARLQARLRRLLVARFHNILGPNKLSTTRATPLTVRKTQPRSGSKRHRRATPGSDTKSEGSRSPHPSPSHSTRLPYRARSPRSTKSDADFSNR